MSSKKKRIFSCAKIYDMLEIDIGTPFKVKWLKYNDLGLAPNNTFYHVANI